MACLVFGVFAGNVLSSISDDSLEKIVLVSPPRAPNKNLLAQNGLFSLHVHSLSAEEPPVIECLSSVVGRICSIGGTVGRWSIEKPMVLLRLPTSEARKLLMYLDEEDVSAATLFPGYEGVARRLDESMTLWHSSLQ